MQDTAFENPEIEDVAKALVKEGKGILAADESLGTIEKRFSAINLESTEENRRFYRELLFTTPEIESYISGVIIFDETIRHQTKDGKSFAKLLEERGIIPGIKVDKGRIDMPGFPSEKLTEGLDDLGKRLEEYKQLGARFTKWRAEIHIEKDIPSRTCINSNAEAMARFAAVSQQTGLVPIVEPEVMMKGNHDIKRCRDVTLSVLQATFLFLKEHRVNLKGLLLKPNMILPGKESAQKVSEAEIAETTLSTFRRSVPSDVVGVVFLSGGQSPTEATKNLNAMNMINDAHWELGFSFGRALQEPVLEIWKGDESKVLDAQKAFIKRARLNHHARYGKYKIEMEEENGK
jgi:fructose-bisphosphate aldolase class I